MKAAPREASARRPSTRPSPTHRCSAGSLRRERRHEPEDHLDSTARRSHRGLGLQGTDRLRQVRPAPTEAGDPRIPGPLSQLPDLRDREATVTALRHRPSRTPPPFGGRLARGSSGSWSARLLGSSSTTWSSSADASRATLPRPSRPRPAGRQRPHPRRDLRARRPRLHDGLRDHRAHQLRPRRRVHGRHVHVAVLPVEPAGAARLPRPAPPTARSPSRSSLALSCSRLRLRHDGHGPHQRDHRALRLPAAAPRPARRPADHRDRRLADPAEHHADHRRDRRPARAAGLPERRKIQILGASIGVAEHLHPRRRRCP